MTFYVCTTDGARYGPATTNELKQWAAEHRLLPENWIEHIQSGERRRAGEIPGLFAQTFQPQVTSIGIASTGTFSFGAAGLGIIWGVWHRAWLTFLIFPVLIVGAVLSRVHPLLGFADLMLTWGFMLWCGTRGSEWAAASRRYATPEALARAEAKWNNAGMVFLGINLLMTVLRIFAIVAAFANP